MARISGNAQIWPANRELPQDLVARVYRRTLGPGVLPFAGKVVTFEVVRNSGSLSLTSGGPLSRTIRRSPINTAMPGCGGCSAAPPAAAINASTCAAPGSSAQSASAPRPPTDSRQINIGGGNNQRAEVGARCPSS